MAQVRVSIQMGATLEVVPERKKVKGKKQSVPATKKGQSKAKASVNILVDEKVFRERWEKAVRLLQTGKTEKAKEKKNDGPADKGPSGKSK